MSDTEIVYTTSTITVYAHNFTIATSESQQLKRFLVPVDLSEVSQLVTSLNPVVLYNRIIRPVRLVILAGQDYILFQA